MRLYPIAGLFAPVSRISLISIARVSALVAVSDPTQDLFAGGQVVQVLVKISGNPRLRRRAAEVRQRTDSDQIEPT
jgi:hypothetical protein